MKNDLLEYKIALCEEMLEIAKILHPGYSRTRAFLLLELQDALMEQIRRNVKQKNINSQDAQVLFISCIPFLFVI